jgi:hypothetical protein
MAAEKLARVEIVNVGGKEDTAVPLSVFAAPSNSTRQHRAVVTTECKSGPPAARVRASSRLQRTNTREDYGEEVELHNIMVQTIHTQEVEVDHDRSGSDGEEWVGVERRVVGGEIV